MIHFEDGVNTTLGLPIIRTSVDHGTAYDIAGTGKASPQSMVAAIAMAAEQAKYQNRGQSDSILPSTVDGEHFVPDDRHRQSRDPSSSIP